MSSVSKPFVGAYDL